ncbi:ankyrin repeat and LEM domain containing 1 [Chamberlinius hualienensis]
MDERVREDVFTSVKRSNLRKVGGYLLDGGDPNLLYLPEGISPLHLASGIKGLIALQIVKLFLIHGGNPNVRSLEGLTPVHISAAWGRYKILKLLLKRGGDPFLCDEDGYDAHDLAQNNNQKKCLDVLKERRIYMEKVRRCLGGNETSTNTDEEAAHLLKFDKETLNRMSQKKLKNESIDSQLTEYNSLNSETTTEDDDDEDDSLKILDQTWFTVDEYLHINDETNETLMEQHWLPSECSSSSNCSISNDSFKTANSTAIWNVSSTMTSTTTTSELDDADLISQLRLFNETPGPITLSTRRIYLRRLKVLKRSDTIKKRNRSSAVPIEIYSNPLTVLMDGKKTINDWMNLEHLFELEFNNGEECWRGGLNRSYFNYLLLDPRKIKNVSNMAADQCFSNFVNGIFYVGKGKNSRSYDHFSQAIQCINDLSIKRNEKINEILDIWNCGFGVVTIHCFHSSLAAEAFTREASIIEAIDVNNLSNVKRGEFYGEIKNWNLKDKCKLGSIFLYRAMNIFLHEGERQIKPCHI